MSKINGTNISQQLFLEVFIAMIPRLNFSGMVIILTTPLKSIFGYAVFNSMKWSDFDLQVLLFPLFPEKVVKGTSWNTFWLTTK